MAETEKQGEFIKWTAILIGLLTLLVYNLAEKVPFFIFLIILCCEVMIFFWMDNESNRSAFLSKWFNLTPKEEPQQVARPFMINYTKLFNENYGKIGNRTNFEPQKDESLRDRSGNREGTLIDNSAKMQNYSKYTEYKPVEEFEEPKLGLDWSFGVPYIEQQEKVPVQNSKEETFEVGTWAQKGFIDSSYSISFQDRPVEHTTKRIEEMTEFILGGIMTEEQYFKEHNVQFKEPKRHVPIVEQPTIFPKPTVEKLKAQSGLFDIKNKQKVENILIPPPSKPQAVPNPETEKPKKNIFQNTDISLSTIPEVKEDSKSKTSAGESVVKDSKMNLGNPNLTLFDSMATEMIKEFNWKSEDVTSSPSKQTKQATMGGIFGQNTTSPPPQFSPPKQQAQSTASSNVKPGPLEMENSNETIAKNKELYLSMSTHAKEIIKNHYKISEAKVAAIKEIVRNFWRDICSSIDDHFLGECEKIIYELNQRKTNEDEYLVFIYELVTQFILEFIDLMSSNKIKIVGLI